MVCLLLLIGLESIFNFVQIKTNKKAIGARQHVKLSNNFERRLQLT
jgi:hypothetical protein